MNFDNICSSTVARVSALLNRQFGCEIFYQSLENLKSDVQSILPSNLQHGDPIAAGDSIFFPIFNTTALAGAAQLSRRDNISDIDIQYIHQVLRLVVENRIQNMNQVEVLEQFESYSLHLKEIGERKSNLISLLKQQSNPFPLPQKKSGAPLNFPFLIESQDPEDIFKMANEIHSRTNRYAMLPIEDISESAFITPDALKQLGQVSIFIGEISKLTPTRQEQLLKYYQSDRTKDCPQILAGTTRPLSEIKQSGELSEKLLSYLMVGYLHMSQPFKMYKRENVLEFFYDRLTGRTSI